MCVCKQDEARRHFNCSSLQGVELENQGGEGTSLNHFEKRVLGVSQSTAVMGQPYLVHVSPSSSNGPVIASACEPEQQ